MEAWECLTVLNGDLNVPASDAFRTVSLPNLTTVNGDVSIDYTYAGEAPPNDSRIIDFPLLTTVGGNYSSTGVVNSLITNTVDLGLEAVTTVTGTISVGVRSTNLSVHGFDALTVQNGNLAVIANGDRRLASFAPNLTTVNGNIDLALGGTSYDVLSHVVQVTGNIHSHAAFNVFITNFFDDLTTVNGSFTATRALPTIWNAGGSGSLSSLSRVTGNLVFENGPLMTVQQTGSPALSVGGDARFERTSLGTMDADFITAAGSVTLRDNCQLDLTNPAELVSIPVGAPSTVSNSGCP
jgi:hypothetical protein